MIKDEKNVLKSIDISGGLNEFWIFAVHIAHIKSCMFIRTIVESYSTENLSSFPIVSHIEYKLFVLNIIQWIIYSKIEFRAMDDVSWILNSQQQTIYVVSYSLGKLSVTSLAWKVYANRQQSTFIYETMLEIMRLYS